MSPVTQGPVRPDAGERGGEPLQQGMLAAAQGDSEAFASLYRALFPQVQSIARRVLRDRALSEEVAQEVILELWTTAGRYRADRGGVHAWVATIAGRRAVDRIRQQCAQTHREVRAANLARTTPHDSVVEHVERVLEHEGVRRSLGALTALQREAIHLAFYQDHTHEEVARHLGIPLGTAKSRIRDALTRLRLELEGDNQKRAGDGHACAS